MFILNVLAYVFSVLCIFPSDVWNNFEHFLCNDISCYKRVACVSLFCAFPESYNAVVICVSHSVIQYYQLIISFHRWVTARCDSTVGHTVCQMVCSGFLPSSLQASTFHPCRPTRFFIPKHGPASGSCSKFKPERGQLLLQPLCCYLPCWGAFSVAGLGSLGEVCDCGWGKEGGEGGRGAQAGLDPSGGIGKKGVRRHLALGLFCGFTFGAHRRWRRWDGDQRRRRQAGHHEWRGVEEEAEGEAEEATGHRGKPSTGEVPLFLHPQKSLP